MSPVVCKFDITSVLVCLSCKAQTECVRVDLLHHVQVGADRGEANGSETFNMLCTVQNQCLLGSQGCGQALHAT